MAVGEEPEQDELERLTLADNGPLDLRQDAFGPRARILDGGQIASTSSTTMRSSSRVGPLASRSTGGRRSGRTTSQA